ncbi:MAG TPA: hypothetical protein VFF68_04175 [Anaerolineaceae bacterium]|nr:hypothetical protein [Anaerolineaceae bacterium]
MDLHKSNRFKGLWILAALIVVSLTAACSQPTPALELTESYESLQSPLTFQYPAGWETSTLPDTSVVVVTREILLQDPNDFQPGDCGMIVTTFTPDYLAFIKESEPDYDSIIQSDPPQAGEVLDLVLKRISRTADDRRTLDLGGRTVEYAILDDIPDDADERQIGLLIIADPNGNYIYMQPMASKDELKKTCENTILAMAETMQSQPAEAQPIQ